MKLDHFGVSSGLSQSSVLALLQDSHGFIWLGTRDGLNMFNGYEFTVYRHIQNDSTSLAGNFINQLAEDHRGNIWVATDKGLSCLLRATGKFVTVSMLEFRCLAVDQTGVVWAGATDGLWALNKTTNVLEKFQASDDEVASYAISALHVDRANNVWVGTARHGLFKVYGGEFKPYENLFTTATPFGSNRIEAIIADNDTSIWVGTYGNGLFHLNSLSGAVTQYHAQHPTGPLVNNNIRSLTKDKQGNLWVGTFEGLSVYSSNFKFYKHIKAVDGLQDGLSHNSVRALLTDTKGSVWIGTYFGGVNVFDPDNQRFEHFYHLPATQSLSYNVVGAFAEDEAGDIWIGTERGGLTRVNTQTNHHTFYTEGEDKKKSLSGHTVKALLADKKNIWAGIFRGGLNKVDLITGNITRYPKNQPEFDRLAKVVVNVVIASKKTDALWLGTDDAGGLHKFDRSTEKYVNFENREQLVEAIASAPVKSIWMDANENLWLATRGSGLIVFNEAAGVLHHFNRSSGLPSQQLTHIYESSDGMVWLTTQGEGVMKFDRKHQQFTRITTEQGLQNNIVFGVLEDNEQQIWFMTIDGISRYEPAKQSFTNNAHAAGFPIEEVNEGAFHKLHNGSFLVGGSNGYTRFDPTKVASNTFVPPVVFTNVLVANQRLQPGDGSGVLQQAILLTDAITFDWHQSVFTIEFAALSFLRAGQNSYQYKLEGFDEQWMDAGTRRSVTYTNLRDGTYTFYVKGANNDGVWNAKPAALTIRVLPPPWKTWWAFTGYGLIILTGFFLVRYNALKSAQLKHELKMEHLQKERIEEMHRLKLQYFTDVSHEFRTPLTLIVNPLEDLLKANEGSAWYQKQLRMMYHNCRRLLLLIDQVLEMRQVETGHAQLKLLPASVTQLVGNVVDSFKGLADHQHITLTYTFAADEQLVELDIDKLEKIFFNLLSNAFKFTPAGGQIQIHIRQKHDVATTWYVFRISDTGRGIEKQNLPHIFDRFYRHGQHQGSGIGLALTKSFVELMGGSITVQSKLNEGSVFTLRIPFTRTKLAQAPVSTMVKSLPPDYRAVFTESPPLATEAGNEVPVVLVVEDNKDLREYLKTSLSKKFNVITARNGEKGLAKARKFGPHLIVSDVMMDVIDGIELCKLIKQDPALSHIPVILLTAKGTDADRLTGLEEGADDYLVKPFMLEELELRITNMLAARKRIHELYQKTNTWSPKQITVTGYDEKLMTRVMKIVEDNLHQPNLTVEFVGSEVGLSRVHLFRKLKALTGQAPADFIRNIRLQQAEQLLKQNKLKVWEVAERVGFQDVTYFSKCFKKVYGCSPTEFQNNFRKETPPLEDLKGSK